MVEEAEGKGRKKKKEDDKKNMDYEEFLDDIEADS